MSPDPKDYPPEGCRLEAVDTGDGWALQVTDPKTEECVAMLAWPDSWPEVVDTDFLAKAGFEVV